MYKNIFIIVLAVVLLAFTGNAQPGLSDLELTNQDSPILNANLFIAVSNTVISPNSVAIICSVITNSSASMMNIVFTAAPIYDSTVSLTDGVGKFYDLTPKSTYPRSIYVNTVIEIEPGKSYNWEIPLNLGKDFKPGNYKLKVIRKIYTKKQLYNLESNSLDIHLI